MFVPLEEGEFPSLGWEAAAWIEANIPIVDGERVGDKFRLAGWQLEFLLHFYRLRLDAVEDSDKPSRAFFYSRGGQLVAPQKIGKAPLSAAQAIVEAFGPVLFAGWDAQGRPVGKPWASPHIQVTAVSEAQTDNVWRQLQPMIEEGDLRADIPDTGYTRINLPGRGLIEPVTSSARSRLGQRVTFAIQDEAHDWTERNGGRKLADTQRRNLAGMGGRFCETGNAWDPNEASVAQQTFEVEDDVYKMFFRCGSGSIRNHRDRLRLLSELYEGSWWVDVDRISSEIDALLGRGEVAQAERFFLNRIVPAEDRAFDLDRWNQCATTHPPPAKGAVITLGVDGARYADALAIVATEVESGYQWLAGLWVKPPSASDDYEHPLDEVNAAVEDLFDRYEVWRLYGDPGSQYANISVLIEKWQGRWGQKRVVEWLMNRPRVASLMIRNYVSAITQGDLTHDGDPRFASHIANARRKPVPAFDDDGRRLWTISKETPGSNLKIDAAAAGALSWEARGDALAAGAGIKKRSAYADQLCACGDPATPHLKVKHR